jgi:hypothetical protein
LQNCSATALAFDVVDAEYSSSLDAIVAISSKPPALHVLDSQTLTDHSVALPKQPVAVSVEPDGSQAAVAYDGFVSLLSLSGPALDKTIPTTCDAFDVVLGGNGFAYVFPNTDQWVAIHSVDLTNEVDLGGDNFGIFEKTSARLHPNGKTIYGSTAQLEPSDLQEYDISGGTARVTNDGLGGSDFGEHEACGPVWMSLDGERVFSTCANVFNASLNASEDLSYAGMLSTSPSSSSSSSASSTLQSVVDSKNGSVYAIAGGPRFDYLNNSAAPNDGVLEVFDFQYLSFTGTLPVPCVETTAGPSASHARFVFASSDGSKLFVIVNVGAGTTWGIAEIDP